MFCGVWDVGLSRDFYGLFGVRDPCLFDTKQNLTLSYLHLPTLEESIPQSIFTKFRFCRISRLHEIPRDLSHLHRID